MEEDYSELAQKCINFSNQFRYSSHFSFSVNFDTFSFTVTHRKSRKGDEETQGKKKYVSPSNRRRDQRRLKAFLEKRHNTVESHLHLKKMPSWTPAKHQHQQALHHLEKMPSWTPANHHHHQALHQILYQIMYQILYQTQHNLVQELQTLRILLHTLKKTSTRNLNTLVTLVVYIMKSPRT